MDVAREDDAERAVCAGLAILAAGCEQAEAAQRLHGVTDFAVRVGVHTGDAGLGKSRLLRELTAKLSAAWRGNVTRARPSRWHSAARPPRQPHKLKAIWRG